MAQEAHSERNDRTIEIMREELRGVVLTERKHHRALEVDKRRAALGESAENDSYTPEFVTSKARELKKKSLSVEEYRCLQNALAQDENNIGAFFKVDNALFALVRDLSSHNPVLQLCAAGCCCNIALGNTKACTALGKSVAPYILAAAANLNAPLAEVCVWTIGNLASGSEKAFEALYSQGSFKLLISLTRDCDVLILPSVVYAAVHTIRAGFDLIEDYEMVNLARALVDRTSCFDDSNTLWVLALLSSKSACLETLLKIVPSIVTHLHDTVSTENPNVTKQTAAIRFLGNVTTESSGQAANEFLNNTNYTAEDVRSLLHNLLTHPHVHVRKETLWFLGNLYNHPSPDVHRITNNLIRLLPSVKQAALTISQNL